MLRLTIFLLFTTLLISCTESRTSHPNYDRSDSEDTSSDSLFSGEDNTILVDFLEPNEIGQNDCENLTTNDSNSVIFTNLLFHSFSKTLNQLRLLNIPFVIETKLTENDDTHRVGSSGGSTIIVRFDEGKLEYSELDKILISVKLSSKRIEIFEHLSIGLGRRAFLSSFLKNYFPSIEATGKNCFSIYTLSEYESMDFIFNGEYFEYFSYHSNAVP